MLFIGITMLGYVSYQKLSIELFPNAQLPALIVQVGVPIEMDPSYIEKQAIVPIEGAIGTLEGIEKIESNISPRFGTIIIYYNQNADLKYANLKLQEKIDIVKTSIPESFIINVGIDVFMNPSYQGIVKEFHILLFRQQGETLFGKA